MSHVAKADTCAGSRRKLGAPKPSGGSWSSSIQLLTARGCRTAGHSWPRKLGEHLRCMRTCLVTSVNLPMLCPARQTIQSVCKITDSEYNSAIHLVPAQRDQRRISGGFVQAKDNLDALTTISMRTRLISRDQSMVEVAGEEEAGLHACKRRSCLQDEVGRHTPSRLHASIKTCRSSSSK